MATKTKADLQLQVAALQELDRRHCASSPAAFIRRHCTIEDTEGAVLPFVLWDFQRETIRALHEDKAVVILKARRVGMSWTVLAYALWLAIFQQGVRILILCKTEVDASELLDRVRRMRDRIAEHAVHAHVLAQIHTPKGRSRDAVTTLDIGASTIRALVGTEAAARSETAGLVILDEFAFQRGAPGIWRAVLPTTEGGGRLACLSTGNGASNTEGQGAEFAEQYTNAASGASGFTALFFPWTHRPDRDEAWKQRTIDALGDPDRFRVEYPETEADAFQSVDVELVYDPAGVNAAERLGRDLDQQLAAGTIAPPAGSAIWLGIDWGLGTTHALVIWPLAGGGLYVAPKELVAHRGEVANLTRQMLERAAPYDYPLEIAAYDSAGGTEMNTFVDIAPKNVGVWTVSFSKHKKTTIAFLRSLFNRAADGHDHKVIAISPTNTVLLRQLRGLRLNQAGDVVKIDDHGPDALIAGARPMAAQFPDPYVKD